MAVLVAWWGGSALTAPRPAGTGSGSFTVSRKSVSTSTSMGNRSVYAGDVVRTSTSSATLQLEDGSRVAMAPNSAVELTQSGGSSAFRALKGRMVARLSPGKTVATRTALVRVRGTEDQELSWEIVQPDGTTDPFPVALRRSIGLVRLSGDDRNDRDLRLVQGSALDRLLSDNVRMHRALRAAGVEAELHVWEAAGHGGFLGMAPEDAERFAELRRFAEAHGYLVDWESVARLDDESLVNGIAQIAPFDTAAKQALLEAPTLADRAELTVQLMQFFGRHDGDDLVTLQ